MYLLDTDVISRTSPLSSADGRSLAAWLQRYGDQAYLSVVSLSEIQYGVARLLQGLVDADPARHWRGGNSPGHLTVEALEEAGIEHQRSYRTKPGAPEN